ncbi:hypothetical protein EPN54_05200 [bacterium]|nr:MAG: hypothetical protein EPN54_05200 [bacterium]
MNNSNDFKSIGMREILIALLLFVFMIVHPRYLGLRGEALSLLPVTFLTLPSLFLYLYALVNRKIKRETFNFLIVIAFFILYVGIKLYRGMDSIGKEGDRDDALYQSVLYFLQGIYPFDKATFCQPAPITCGPASVLFSLPFVFFFNNINIFPVFVMAFIIFYLWKYVEKETGYPILTLALSVMVFFPYFNWCYWESAEDILCGWPFLYLSLFIFLKGRIKTAWLRFFIIGILLGISCMFRISYLFPAAAVLFLILRNNLKYLAYSVLGAVLIVILLSLPFLVLNYKHFLSGYLWGTALYTRGNFEMLFFVIIVLFQLYCTVIRKLPLASQAHILIALSAIAAYVYSGLLLIPWHVYYWMIPLLIALPFIERPQRE